MASQNCSTISINRTLRKLASRKRTPQRSASRRRGTAFIEFFLVLPLLVVLITGIVQYGLIASTTAVLTNLSREGARYASLSASTQDQSIIDYVKAAAASTRVHGEDLTVTVEPVEATRKSPTEVGQKVTVSVQYDLSKQLFLPGSQYIINAFSTGGQRGIYKTSTTMRIQST